MGSQIDEIRNVDPCDPLGYGRDREDRLGERALKSIGRFRELRIRETGAVISGRSDSHRFTHHSGHAGSKS